jgi:hypothetical protein
MTCCFSINADNDYNLHGKACNRLKLRLDSEKQQYLIYQMIAAT